LYDARSFLTRAYYTQLQMRPYRCTRPSLQPPGKPLPFGGFSDHLHPVSSTRTQGMSPFLF